MYLFSSLFLQHEIGYASIYGGIDEKVFGCSVYPIRETLGNYIHRIILHSCASHEILFCYLGIIAGEKTSRQQVGSTEVLLQCIMLYLQVANVEGLEKMNIKKTCSWWGGSIDRYSETGLALTDIQKLDQVALTDIQKQDQQALTDMQNWISKSVD
jgi:hypothetical protein